MKVAGRCDLKSSLLTWKGVVCRSCIALQRTQISCMAECNPTTISSLSVRSDGTFPVFELSSLFWEFSPLLKATVHAVLHILYMVSAAKLTFISAL
jgi:hypothetical protein